MKVTVELFGPQRDRAGRHALELDLPDGATVADAIRGAGLVDRVDLWVLLDGRRVERDSPLADGARLVFFSPVGGG